MNKFQFVVYLKSAVTFFHGNGKELLGVKGPPTNSKTIISLCNQVVLVHYHVKKKNCRNKICQGPMSFFDGNNITMYYGSFSRNGSYIIIENCSLGTCMHTT